MPVRENIKQNGETRSRSLDADGQDGEMLHLSCSDTTTDNIEEDPGDREKIINKAWEMQFRIGISRRYNSHLASHYSGLENGATVLSLIGGSASFGAVFGARTSIVLLASLLVVAAMAVSRAFRWSDKARQHDDLYRQYTRLGERLVRAGDDEVSLREIEADFTLIEVSEPAIKEALMVICHNQQARFQRSEETYPLRWWQSLFAAFLTLPPRTWER